MKMMHWIASGLCALAAFAPVMAGAEPPKALFADQAPLHIVMRGPITGLANGKTPLDATLTVVGGTPETLPIQISARGITRRKHEICPFPPIKVEFASKPGPDSLFAKQKVLKLVTHCRNEGGEQFALLELAAYRIYEVITPLSYKTRLATIDYVDPNGKPIITRSGFFIEDIHDLAKRNEMALYKTTERVPSVEIGAHGAARFALFEAMIGNLDWAMNAGPVGTQCCHNARLLGAPATPAAPGEGLVPVPRDFDLAGLIDAPYAYPPEGIDVADVRERRYRGYCRTNGETTVVAAELLGQRAAILGVLDGIPGLDDKQKHKAQAYLAGFFDRISTPAGLSKLTSTCL